MICGTVPLSLTVPSLPLPFTYISVFTLNGDLPSGGDDVISVGGGRNIVIGGQGSDRITGGAGNDDLIGGHNVAVGDNGLDTINGGGGSDAIIYGNGTVELVGGTGTAGTPAKIDNSGATPGSGSGPARKVTEFGKKKKKKKKKKKPVKKPTKKPKNSKKKKKRATR